MFDQFRKSVTTYNLPRGPIHSELPLRRALDLGKTVGNLDGSRRRGLNRRLEASRQEQPGAPVPQALNRSVPHQAPCTS